MAKAEESPKSPQLTRLRQAIATGDALALELFWQQLSTQGSPLIEPGEETADFSLVTFIWQSTAATEQVMGQIAVDGTGQDEHDLTRLPDTDLWFATFRLRNDYRAAYKFIVTESGQVMEKPDPLNPKRFIEPKDAERPDHAEDDIDSVVELPAAPPQPWAAPRAGVAAGEVCQRRFYSQILDNERRIWVYTPPDYNPSGRPYGLLIVLDGRFFTFAVGTPDILDNLLADGQIAPLVAVMVDNPGSTWEQSMAIRGKEQSCHPPFARFLAQELVPWLPHHYHITTDPRKTFLVGGSNAGLAAAFTAWQHPDTFGNVLALSGSFWWKPEGETEWEWLTRQFALSPLRPLRFYIEVGLLESAPTPTGFPGQLLANRHLRHVLQAKGYELHYDKQMHGHDSVVWPGVLAEGLIALQQGKVAGSNAA